MMDQGFLLTGVGILSLIFLHCSLLLCSFAANYEHFLPAGSIK